ncbi:hypothetical protein [Streptomyces uncialis]|uniref:Lipoprotein n=1 Tax=Streptomyces uncialis TaxID=1048205 RepID=A0A1Q4V0W4_9ACTN|nr:hypothetical protein [Streptomyces uncialis]OKH91515.1 hypothetical protein AB852_28585 [Streptomyces uncialis]
MPARITISTAALLLAAALTACGGSDSGDSKADEKPKNSSAPAASKKATEVDCTAEDIDQKTWNTHCSGEIDGAASAGPEEPLALGKPAGTVGDQGAGVLEITPTTVVYTKAGGGGTSQKGTFVFVTVKARATTGAAAEVPAPITGNGWQWIAPGGEAIGWGSGDSVSVQTESFDSTGPVQPGSFQWRSTVFDLTPAQAKGGTLQYLDGDGAAYRWKIPGADTGPQIAEVKKQLAG